MQNNNRVKILGVPVDMVDRQQAFSIFEDIFQNPGCSMIVTPNSEIVQNASKDEELKSLIASADLIIPDGIGLVYASKIMGCPLSERVTGIDFLEKEMALFTRWTTNSDRPKMGLWILSQSILIFRWR